MRKRFHKIIFALIGTFLFWIAVCEVSFGSLNLSVSSLEGSNAVRFGRADLQTPTSKELRVRISATGGEQYQVFQRIVEPFVNEQGMTYDEPFLQYYGLAGSNSAGTIFGQAPEFIFRSDQLIYSSSQAGDADAFTLYYCVDPQKLKASGRFFGKIIFTARPIGSGNQSEAFLDVYVDSSGELKVDVRSSHGGEVIRLGTAGLDQKEDIVNINFTGNQGKTLRVYQEVEEFPRNEKNDYFPNQVIKYVVEGNANSNIRISSPEYLTNKPEMIYESGLSTDTFTVHYLLPEDGKEPLKAATYKGRVRYRIDDGQGEKVFLVELEVNVNPFFELSLNMISGNIHFSHLIPDEPPQFKEVEVDVKSNLGKPYMVVQKILDLLRNTAGEKIDEKFFTFKEQNEEGQLGKVSQTDFVPFAIGEKSIFFSDAQGSSTKFKMIFRLQPYRGMAPGDYSAAIQYSLVEI